MLCVVLIHFDEIKFIFRSWQQRSAVCFGVASAKGKKENTIYYCMVFIPSYIKLSVEENEETFSDIFVQINTFLEAYMLFFLERGSLTEMFSRKIVNHHLFPKQWIILCLLLTLFFFRSEGFSEEGCRVVTSKSNLEETVCSCNHLTHFAILMSYDGSTKVIK